MSTRKIEDWSHGSFRSWNGRPSRKMKTTKSMFLYNGFTIIYGSLQ